MNGCKRHLVVDTLGRIVLNIVHPANVHDSKRVDLTIRNLKPIANLNKFKDAFLKRYETREVRLTEVLDTDIGFGFSDLTPESAGTNPLLDNYHDFLKNGLSEIEITDEDLARFPENWSDLPDTISVMAEIIRSESDDDTPLVYIKNAGGSSAANLLARFASSNEDIFEIFIFPKTVQEIYYYAQRYTKTLRRLSGFNHQGVSLMGIKLAAETLGLEGDGIRLTREQLIAEIEKPLILFWNQKHFVVLISADSKKFTIADPAQGTTDEDGDPIGFALRLKPTDEFYKNKPDQKQEFDWKLVFRYWLTVELKQEASGWLQQLLLGNYLL
eukprot:gene7930-8002_t